LQIRHLVEIAGMMTANPTLATGALIIYLSTWVLICERTLVDLSSVQTKKKCRREQAP
jgi:hypothetical protein